MRLAEAEQSSGAHGSVALLWLTDIVFKRDIRTLRDAVFVYLGLKKGVHILVDNLDKGWSAAGISDNDTKLMQALLNAGRKIQRDALRHDVEVLMCVFLRDDVYEFVVREASDRGKETVIRLSWSDPATLETLLNRRLAASSLELGLEEELCWANVAEPQVGGVPSFSYLAMSSMYRPRALLDIVELAFSFAAQASHEKILEGDLERAVKSYSVDLIQGINFEIRDVFPEADKAIYLFANQNVRIDLKSVRRLLGKQLKLTEQVSKLTDILLWVGFLGLVAERGREVFIFDVGESLDLLKAQGGATDNPIAVLHPMFRLALRTEAALLF
ncbi:MAG: P-loop ATPase, Sll1717 family [Caulobacterales bacterium]